MKATIFETCIDDKSRFVSLDYYNTSRLLGDALIENPRAINDRGAAAEYADFLEAIQQSETVISVAAPSSSWEESQRMLQHHCNIIKAMTECGARKLITIGSSEMNFMPQTLLPPEYDPNQSGGNDGDLLSVQYTPAADRELITISRWAEAFQIDWSFFPLPKGYH